MELALKQIVPAPPGNEQVQVGAVRVAESVRVVDEDLDRPERIDDLCDTCDTRLVIGYIPFEDGDTRRRRGCDDQTIGVDPQIFRQLILMALDASSVQLEKIRTTLHDRTIPQAVLGDRDMLGAAVGLAPLSAVAVTNASLADRLLVELDESSGEDGKDESEVSR